MHLSSLEQLLDLANHHRHVVLITDQNIAHHYPSLLSHFPKNIVLQPGEKSKTLESVTHCWTQLSQWGADRQSAILALGGGVITDIAGFAAGCYMRGIDFYSAPTSMIGMVDAGIGGKTGFNFDNRKNLIGLFNQPKKIFLCTTFLKTLPSKEFHNGLAEVIKYALISDPGLFELLENNAANIISRDVEILDELIRRSYQIKQEIVSQDPKEKGLRAILNFGHTFGHAIESLTHYSCSHGEAVSIGMSCATQLSEQLGFLKLPLSQRLRSLLNTFGLPIELPEINIDALIEQMQKDKKAIDGNLSFILLKNLGEAFKLDNVSAEDVKKFLYA